MDKYNKLFSVLKSIEKNEIKETARYIDAFYSEKKQQAVQLFHLLQIVHPQFNKTHPNMQIPMVCKLLAATPAQLTYIVSDLVIILEDYMSYRVYIDIKKTGNIFLPQALEQRGLSKYIPNTVKQLQNDLNRNVISNDKKLLYQYWCNEILVNYIEENKDQKKADALKNMFQSLDDWYYYQILKTATTLLNDKLFKNYSYELPENLDSIILKLEQKEETPPILALYLSAIKLFLSQQELLQLNEQSLKNKKLKKQQKNTEQINEGNAPLQIMQIKQQQEQLFSQLLNYIQSLSYQVSLADLRDWYNYALNFCYLKYNEKDISYILKINELYELILNKQLLLNETQNIEQEQYKNMIKIYIGLRRFDYATRFINDYRRFLPDDVRNDATNYANALVHFWQDNYNEALYHLIRIKSNDMFYRVDIAVVEIACYYEKNAGEQLENKLNSFSLFLDKNKKITPTLYQPYKYIIELVRRLWQIKNELASLRYKEIPRYATKENVMQLKGDIEQMTGYKWLNQKIIELEQKIFK